MAFRFDNHLEPDWPETPPSAVPTTLSSTPPNQAPDMPSTHFLSLARNPAYAGASAPGVVDTATVAAADFDVDAKTGFMPPHPPIARLPGKLEIWENVLQDAFRDGEPLTLGERATNRSQTERSFAWRRLVDEIPVLSLDEIRGSEVLLRQAHRVLTFVMHLYIHSQPPLLGAGPHSPVRIPACLAVPLVQLADELVLPPILTYSDNVLYNWVLKKPAEGMNSFDNIDIASTFSLTQSEKHFYLTSAWIELRGVEALDLMRSSLDEAFVGDEVALRRITEYLNHLAVVIDDLSKLLMAVRDDCDPRIFYEEIRPWFRGYSPGGREWLFEGVSPENQAKYARLSGPSAGQSSLVHALDVFLGVDHTKKGPEGSPHDDPTFLMKMEQYMPRHHRAFLQHLRSANQTHIRNLISAEGTPALEEAYDRAVMALKRFRDGHIRIATLYIVSQARRQAGGLQDNGLVGDLKARPPQQNVKDIRGTGGTSLVPFLKEARDNTLRAVLATEEAENGVAP